MEFLTHPGHQETIFDLAFKPSDPNILATSSYDSTVKIWYTPTMKCLNTLEGQAGVLYGLSWSPISNESNSNNQLASCSSKGEVYIWDTETGIPVKKMHHHTKAVYRVDWNKNNTDLLVSSSGDCTCCVFTREGQILYTLRHPDIVYGCEWSPFDPTYLVTGCKDGEVRVYNTADLEESNQSKRGQKAKPMQVFHGHSRKVFNTVWSPLLPGTLASGSDDLTIRVWQQSSSDRSLSSLISLISQSLLSPLISRSLFNSHALRVLKGHTDNVRALVWNSELAHILMSGAWDGTIRLWDVMQSVCLRVVSDHHADVYGLQVCTLHLIPPHNYLTSSPFLSSHQRVCTVAPAATLRLCLV